MKRGELYRVFKGRTRDPKRSRVFVVVSRPILIDSKVSTVICAPVSSARYGLSTQVPVGPAEGLKRDGSIACDDLVSLPKPLLTDFVGSLSAAKVAELRGSLASALAL